jgi:hypothetical protein|tara:strand:- start:4981 stop:5556 length:576 start_codon:yes stop_codon:yes gene_type:complete
MEKELMKQALELMPGELKQTIKDNLENPKSYTRLFVKILDEIDKMKVILPKFTTLKNSILKINEKNHSKITNEMKHYVPKTQSTLSLKDIEYWLQTAKKGEQLIYYTGGTFDRRSVKDESIFRKIRNLAMDYDNIPYKNKKYQYRGSVRGEWGCNYTNIITLVQKRVAKEQRDKEKNIISYPIYNYIMIKQ